MLLPGVDRPLELVERDIPNPGPGEVLVRVEACGVCGSDLFLQKGGFGTALPVVPGHEAAGVVADVGDGVDPAWIERQVALYYISTPEHDSWADAGHPNVSPQVKRMGVDTDGAFAEYVTRPVSCLIEPSQRVEPAVLAVLTDAVATPVHALRRVAQVQPGESLVVVGIGGLGSNAVQLGKLMGAHVIAVSRSRGSLDLAERLGADHVVQSRTGGQHIEEVRAITGGNGADVVLQCAGSAKADEDAIAMGGPMGRVVMVGSSSEAFECRAVDLIWRELKLLGSRGFIPADIEEAIEHHVQRRIDISHLVETVRPLEEANEALDDLANGRVVRSVLAP